MIGAEGGRLLPEERPRWDPARRQPEEAHQPPAESVHLERKSITLN